jgi:hypothetical protein
MGLVTTFIIAAPLAAFSPFSTTSSATTPELPESFRVQIVDPKDSTSPSTAGTSQRAAPQSRTDSNSETGGPIEPCDRIRSAQGTSTNIHDDSERPDERSIRFTQRRAGYCREAHLLGVVTFTADERDVASLGRRARVRFREVTAGSDREITITSSGDQPRREYLFNGRPVTLDDDARSWLAGMVLLIVRESGYNAPSRLRRLEQEGGANRVFREIDAIQGSSAKQTYYTAFLESGSPLADSTLTQMLAHIHRDFQTSSGDLSTLLAKIPLRSVQSPQARSAFAGAMRSIDSDGDKSTLLLELVPTADAALLVEMADVALTIESDGDKSRVLIAAAASFLTPRDTRLRDSFFRVAETIESDGDLARVLIGATPFAHADAGVTEEVIRVARQIESDGDKSNVLTNIATQRLLTTQRVKDAFMEAARTIQSDGDRTRVLRAAMIG